eukprot:gene5374-6046_t
MADQTGAAARGSKTQENPAKVADEVVSNLKSQGLFDKFRKECLEELENMESYRLLKQRVENHVASFLSKYQWSEKLSKNSVRDSLRTNINRSEVLLNGIDRIIDQILSSKTDSFAERICPEVDKHLGLEKKEAQNLSPSENTVPSSLPSSSFQINTAKLPSNSSVHHASQSHTQSKETISTISSLPKPSEEQKSSLLLSSKKQTDLQTKAVKVTPIKCKSNNDDKPNSGKESTHVSISKPDTSDHAQNNGSDKGNDEAKPDAPNPEKDFGNLLTHTKTSDSSTMNEIQGTSVTKSDSVKDRSIESCTKHLLTKQEPDSHIQTSKETDVLSQDSRRTDVEPNQTSDKPDDSANNDSKLKTETEINVKSKAINSEEEGETVLDNKSHEQDLSGVDAVIEKEEVICTEISDNCKDDTNEYMDAVSPVYDIVALQCKVVANAASSKECQTNHCQQADETLINRPCEGGNYRNNSGCQIISAGDGNGESVAVVNEKTEKVKRECDSIEKTSKFEITEENNINANDGSAITTGGENVEILASTILDEKNEDHVVEDMMPEDKAICEPVATTGTPKNLAKESKKSLMESCVIELEAKQTASTENEPDVVVKLKDEVKEIKKDKIQEDEVDVHVGSGSESIATDADPTSSLGVGQRTLRRRKRLISETGDDASKGKSAKVTLEHDVSPAEDNHSVTTGDADGLNPVDSNEPKAKRGRGRPKKTARAEDGDSEMHQTVDESTAGERSREKGRMKKQDELALYKSDVTRQTSVDNESSASTDSMTDATKDKDARRTRRQIKPKRCYSPSDSK